MDGLTCPVIRQQANQLFSHPPAAKPQGIARIPTAIGTHRRLLASLVSKDCDHFGGEIGSYAINDE
jgi:hypothetical protein